jgi:hypothetical protein
MGKTQLALLGLGATILAGFAAVTPAAAHDYPWCAQGGGYEYPGDCTYSTYGQCQASVSGRLMACGSNPLVAYGQAPLPQPRPPRRTRPVAPY